MNKWFKIFSMLLLLFSITIITGCKKDKDDDKEDDTPPVVEYTISYNTTEGAFIDGTTTKSEKFAQNTRASIISDVPVLSGYTFMGWFIDGTNEQVSKSFIINKNVSLVAKWEETIYEVVYDAGSGEFSDGSSELIINVKPNATFTYSETPIIRDGRLFNGWYNDITKEYVEEGTVITSDLEVYAKYTRPGELMNITFVLNGGKQDTPVNDNYYERIRYNLPTPTKEGFEFLGWYETEDFQGEPIKYISESETGNKVFYASWKLVNIDYVNTIMDELVPSELTDDITLPINYQGLKLYWMSSNYNIFTAKGVIKQTHVDQKVTVQCQVTYEGKFYDLEKEVTIKALQFEYVANPVAGYFYNTSVRNKTETFLENFDIAYCAFAYVSASGNVSLNSSSTGCTAFINEMKTLQKNGIRCVLSIAGGASNFSTACYKNIATVVTDIINLVRTYNFDGVDIDWEFPNDATDTANMTLLCKMLRQRLDNLSGKNGTPYLLTAAIPSHESYLKYDLEDLNEYLDYVNMMSYDMNQAGRTSHLCPLFRGHNDQGRYGVDLGIKWFTEAGFDKNKIIIGSAFYGKAYNVTGTQQSGATYPGLGVGGELASLQYDSGTVTYKWMKQNVLKDSDYIRYYDTDAQVPYLYNESKKIFITYEDAESLIAKVEYAYQEGLGIMFWDYSYDYNNELTDTICNRMYQLRNNIEPEL